MDATSAETHSDSQAEPAAESLSAEDEQKRRFREALEAKRGGAGKGAGGGPGDGKVHGAHGQAGAKRQFRRKSGG
jgi:hypothetical protein